MARISKLRGTSSFRRKPGHTPPRSITLIVCEGETEQTYLEAVRIHYGLSRAEVVLIDSTSGSAPINVVACAERKGREHGGYDQIFCVFDRDDHESFERARARIRSLASRRSKRIPIHEAISIPCFEFWVLLHFERTDRSFQNCDSIVERICALHMAHYRKADARTAKELTENMGVALENAEWLEARAPDNKYDPYTSVHKMIGLVAAVAGKGASR